MKVGSLFSGVGGFDLGLECAGMDVVWQVENDKWCRQVLRARWPDVNLYGDVNDVGSDLNDVDLICGGFPCQDLSVAGKRAGLDGERSGLWFEFLRIADSVAPRWVLIENVPGLLSSNGGSDFAVLLHGLTGFHPDVPEDGWQSAGYCEGPKRRAFWRVLDTQHFGPPQRRRRVFIVADSRARCGPEILLEPESVPGHPAAGKSEGQEPPPNPPAGTLPSRRQGGGFPGTDGACDRHVVAPTIPASGAGTSRPGWPGLGSEEKYVVGYRNGPRENWRNNSNPVTEARMLVPGETATTLDGHYYKGPGARGNKERAFVAAEAGYSEYREDHPHLRSHGGEAGHGSEAITGAVPRRLTPRECERLQGFPDDWTARGIDADGEPVEISDTQRYKQMGNAVSVPVAAWIGARIVAQEMGAPPADVRQGGER